MIPLLLILGACDGGVLGKDYECERPAGSPADRGFVGDAGDDGCVADDACVSEPGDEGGTCVRGAECVLDGLSSGTGFSKDCIEGYVCVVPDGTFYGNCAALDPPTDDIGGTVDCNLPIERDLEVAAGEVLELFALFSPPEDPDAGVRATMRIEDSTGPIVLDGEILGDEGTVDDRALGLELRHSFQQSTTLTFVFEVDECNATELAASVTPVWGAIANGAVATAMPLAQDEAVTSVIGCFDQTGSGAEVHLAHYYALHANAGDVLDLTLSAETWGGSGLTGWIYLTLEDASGPVLDGGEAVGIDTYETSDVALSYTVKKAGGYFLKVEQDTTYCDVARYTVSY